MLEINKQFKFLIKKYNWFWNILCLNTIKVVIQSIDIEASLVK